MSTNAKSKSVGLEIIRFLVVGVIATIFDFFTKLLAAKGLFALGIDGAIYENGTINFFSKGGLNYTLSIICGFIVGVIVNYIFSRIWVFQNVADQKKANSTSKFFLFVFLGFIGLLISLLIFWGAVFLIPLINKSVDVYEGSKSISADLSFLKNGSFWAYAIVFCFSTLIVLIWNYLSRKKWIFKAPKEEEVKEEAAPIEEETKAVISEPKKEAVKEKKDSKNDEKVVEAQQQEDKKEETPKVEPVKEEASNATSAKEETKAMGKYEVFPEAGGFKYRLKANNGEILIVSNAYSIKKGAISGISTLKKNIQDGVKSVQTDKNGYSQFRIFTPNDGRLIATGEVYKSVDSANNALNSVIKFSSTEKIVELSEIPEKEIRDWKVDINIEAKQGGKIEYFNDEAANNKWRARLLANNGQIMFVTDGAYATKTAASNAIESIKKLIDSNSFHILRDKQGRYQFQLASTTGAVLVRGESYDAKERAISAATSVASFIDNAKVVEPKDAKEEEKKPAPKKKAVKKADK